MDGLNDSQRRAFLMAVDGSPVSLIKGPPGTGKTHVINAIVQYITKELKQKVVISSQTHVAIDNVLDELMENYDLIIPNRITMV
jgi:chromosomal replication initiation ATPase DnaA